jgi:hypothetical protein
MATETLDTKPSLLASRKFQMNMLLAALTGIALVACTVLVAVGKLDGDKFVELLKWAFGQLGLQGAGFSLAQGMEDAAARRPAGPTAVAGDAFTTNVTNLAPKTADIPTPTYSETGK